MSDTRPNPDSLLARIQAEERSPNRGKLKIFFGAAPGVGKTYAMLEAARSEAKAGADVLVGFVESHARPDTQALLLGLEILPRRVIDYRGITHTEFDLEAALKTHPHLLLVDELAHTNAPGVTHAKRWQDVEQLLAAGINVYTTLNVQHLESLNDIVARITGVTVRETVPDSVFFAADEVEVVDLPPDDLLERLREGKVYLPPQAAIAVENYFRKGNLIALRELALRRTAERVNAQMEDWRRAHDIQATWPAAERLLVCVGPSPLSSRVVRAAARMARGLQAPWLAVHVETPLSAGMPEVDRTRLAHNLELAEQLGAETVTLSGATIVEEVVSYAQTRNVTKIIIGKPRESRWRELLRGSVVYELTRQSGAIDVYVISGDTDDSRRPEHRVRGPTASYRGYLWATAAVAICTGIGWLLLIEQFHLVNIVMVYLLGVVAISLRCGQGPSVLTSILAVAAFDFFFVPPRFTFAVDDAQYLLTFAVMLVTGLTITALTGRLKLHADFAQGREQRTAALYALCRDLAAVETVHEIVQTVVRHAGEALDASVALLLPDDKGRVATHPTVSGGFDPDDKDQGVAQWVFDHRQEAGLGTRTLTGANALYIPMLVSGGCLGVLGVRPAAPHPVLLPEQIHLLEVFASQAAASLERANLAAEAEQARVQVEGERLRNALLSAVSHDLRTPLAAIAGASSTLLDDGHPLDANTRRDLLQMISEEVDALNRLVGNLLDMTRLEAGVITLQRDWQSTEEIVGAALHRLTARLKDHPIATRLAADLPLTYVDGMLIQQVLVNLLENAAKYSPPKSPIEISARLSGQRLIVEVADRGQGFPPDQEQMIFEKFFRLASSNSRAGAGLGLTICRGIVELHGGRIHARNRPGGGAILTFELPIERQAPEVVVPPRETTAAT